MKRLFSVATIILFMSISLTAQNSGVRGTITDKTENNEPLPFAKIQVEGSTSGAQSGFDGAYQLKLKPGTYTILYSFSTYKVEKVEITVKENEFFTHNIGLGLGDEVIKEFTVKVDKVAEESLAAINNTKKEAAGAMDGSSSQQMKEQGDSDAGDAIKRVTGVSTKGSDVYVRGLGDKYTKTTLNTVEIPGLDPDKNAVQMDIFPTNLISNIMVYKTFTPDLYGDFSGGLVNVTTKDLPRKKVMNFSAGLGYNSVTTFNPNFILYSGGATDFLGFDDGTRKMPVSPTRAFPDPTRGEASLTRLTKAFNPEMAVSNQTALPNQSFSFGYGNVKDSVLGRSEAKYGYNFNFNYNNSYQFFENVMFGAYRKEPEQDINALFPDRISRGQMGRNNVMWSTLFAQTLKLNEDHKFTLNAFHTQNGISEAASLLENNYELNPAILHKQSLQYTQRSVSSVNLNGKHTMNEKWKANWAIAPSLSRMSNPDIRSTILEEEDFLDDDGNPVYSLNPSVGGEVRRIFRNLTELNLNSKADFEYSFNPGWDTTLTSKVKLGFAQSYKTRQFRVYDFIFNLENVQDVPNDPNWFLQDENVWTPESDQGTYASGERQIANSFDANQLIVGAYAMNDLPVNDKFKVIYGVRAEQAINRYTGENNAGTVTYDNDVVLNELSILPSINTVYILKNVDTIPNRVNLRGAYAKTLARPSFKEKSIAQIYDPIQGRRYNGNIDLMQTDIHNFDLRWEKFYGETEVLSASAFYKKFINPIELVSFDLAPNEVQPTNAGEANMYGFELEARKLLGFVSNDSRKIFAGANYTYINTQIDMTQVMIRKGTEFQSEYEIRQANAREGEVIGQYRTMYGQSPFLVNGYLSFADDSTGLKVNVSYNVQGRQLTVIGIGAIADVYERPFHSLNLKASKSFGPERKWNASLNFQNILNNKRVRYYDSYESDQEIYDFFQMGRTVSASISYTLK